jgi:uncharacterized membrane protein
MSASFFSLCPSCPENLAAREAVFGPSFLPLLLAATVPFIVLAGAVVVLRRARPLFAAGLALGVGLGGFVDGIVLHQILQWHEMFSSVLPPTELVAVKVNMLGDGIFHAATWAATAAGVALLISAARRVRDVRRRPIAAGMLAGWGAFNLLEGVIDHQLLGMHHVHPGAGQLAWDVAFLASGVVLLAIGAASEVASDTRNPRLARAA